MMVRVASLIEERLTDEALAALKSLVGCKLQMRMPWIESYSDGSFVCDKIMFMRHSTNESSHRVLLELAEFEAPITKDYCYRYTISIGDELWKSIVSANPSFWSYGSNLDRSSVTSIEVYSYTSIPEQIRRWPDLEELSEAQSFDCELLLIMSDHGRVSIKPMHNWDLLSVTLRPSFELPHYRRKLGENLSLRLTIN
jgi:hypothetical protein